MPTCSPTACYKCSSTFSHSLLPNAFDWLADFESGFQNLFNHIHQVVPCPSLLQGFSYLGCSVHSTFHTPASTGLCSQSSHRFLSKDIKVDVSDNFVTLENLFIPFFITLQLRICVYLKWTCFLLSELIKVFKIWFKEIQLTGLIGLIAILD